MTGPPRGWKALILGVGDGMREDRLPLVAAGVAFYSMTSIVPALAALVSIYGLFADPAMIDDQIGRVMRAVPAEVTHLVADEVTRLSAAGETSLSLGVVIATLVSLWSASAAVNALMLGVGVSFDDSDERGFVKRRGIALVLTLGAILLAAVALGLIVVLPLVMDYLRVGTAGRTLVSVLRWPVLALVAVLGFGVLYRLGPSGSDAEVRWLSPGAVVGTGLWLIGSALFSLYVSRFGRYDEAYGALGAVLVLLLWLWISALSILVGARIDAEFTRPAPGGPP